MLPRPHHRGRRSQLPRAHRSLCVEPLEVRTLMADLAVGWTGPGFFGDQAKTALLDPKTGYCDTDFLSGLGVGFGGGGDLSMVFGTDGDIYAANQGYLFRLDAVTGRIRPWPTLAGGHLTSPLGPNGIEDTSIALGPNGELYVATVAPMGSLKPASVHRYDARTGLAMMWPATPGGVIGESVEDISIAFGPRGDLYVAYTTYPGQGDGYFARLDATTGLMQPWERVGAGYVGGTMEDISIAVAPDGDVIVAGSHHANDGTGRLSGTLSRFDSRTGMWKPWPLIGSASFGHGIDDPNVVVTSEGEILVASLLHNPSATARAGIISRFDLRTGRANPWHYIPGGYGGPAIQHFTIAAGRLDSDEDGLPDAWESRGIDVNFDGIVDLDLPALGARPDHKDLFVEVDAMSEDLNGNGILDPGEDRPDGVLEAWEDLNANGRADPGEDQVNNLLDRMAPWRRNAAGTIVANNLDDVVTAFANAPVANPDGTDGIFLHVLSDEDDLPLTPWPDKLDDFDRTKASRFGTVAERNDPNWPQISGAKRLVYRYCVFAGTHSGRTSSGLAEGAPANDFMVTLWSWTTPAGVAGGTADEQRSTFMHELGHTLGLRHGGGDDTNYKPNYHSIMNYTWQIPQAAYAGSWILDYSREALATLDENNLDESAGVGFPAGSIHATHQVPAGPFPLRMVNEVGPVDWSRDDRDGDGIANNDTGIVADVNLGDHNQDGRIDANDATPGEVLRGYDDWASLWYRVRGAASFFDGQRPANSWHDEMTREEYRALRAATGEFPAGEIHGTVWDDANSNGVRDRGERGLEGWTVYVDSNTNGRFDTGEPSAITDNAGVYALTRIGDGTHFVREVIRSDWRQTFPSPMRAHEVSMGAGQIFVGIDFGNRYVADLVAPWQNYPVSRDTNNDAYVSPLDALLLINRLAARGTERLSDSWSSPPTVFYDVNGDHFVSPSDALLIINHLNRNYGEGEQGTVVTSASATTDASSAATWLPFAASTALPEALLDEVFAERKAGGPGACEFCNTASTVRAADTLFAGLGDKCRTHDWASPAGNKASRVEEWEELLAGALGSMADDEDLL